MVIGDYGRGGKQWLTKTYLKTRLWRCERLLSLGEYHGARSLPERQRSSRLSCCLICSVRESERRRLIRSKVSCRVRGWHSEQSFGSRSHASFRFSLAAGS